MEADYFYTSVKHIQRALDEITKKPKLVLMIYSRSGWVFQIMDVETEEMIVRADDPYKALAEFLGAKTK